MNNHLTEERVTYSAETHLQQLGVQIAQPEIHNEQGRREGIVTLFNLYGVKDNNNKCLFSSNHVKSIPPQHRYVMLDERCIACQRKVTDSWYHQTIATTNLTSVGQKSVQILRDIERQYDLLVENAEYHNLSGKKTWIDFPGFITLVYTNKNWLFLKFIVTKMLERYGFSQLASLNCTTVLRHDTNHLPHATNLDNKELMNFLASKSGVLDISEEGLVEKKIGERLIRFFHTHQTVAGKAKPSDIMDYILDKGGYSKKISDETVQAVHGTWIDDDVQQGLLAVFGKGKRVWDRFRRATTVETDRIKTIVPKAMIVRGNSVKMPKLLRSYKSIMTKASKKYDFNSQFQAVRIPRQPETEKKREILQKKIKEYTTALESRRKRQVEQKASDPVPCTQDSSQVTDSQQASVTLSLVDTSNKTKKRQRAQHHLNPCKKGRQLPLDNETIQHQQAFTRTVSSFQSMIADQCSTSTSRTTYVEIAKDTCDYYSNFSNIQTVDHPSDSSKSILVVPTLDMFVAGDAALVHKYALKTWRKHFTHIWIRNMKSDCEELLAVSEGKDDYSTIEHLIKELLPLMISHETQGVVCEGNLFRVRYHWGGDMAYLLSMLGMKPASSKWWCLDCMQQNMEGQWWTSRQRRDLDQELTSLDLGTEIASRIKRPIILYWYKLGGRIHYCALHVNISFAKGLVRAFIHRAIMNQENAETWNETLKFSNQWSQLEEKYGQKLHTLLEWSHSPQEPLQDLKNYINIMGYSVSQNACLTELVEDALTICDELESKYSELSSSVGPCESDQPHKVALLQQLFYDNNISINFLECLGTSRSPSVIGDHAWIILSILDKIRAVIDITDDEYENLKQLHRILSCVMKKEPKLEDVDLYVTHGVEVVRRFLENFKLDPWNYCHVLVTHMREDMIVLQRDGMSVGMFSISNIENLGSKLKRILKYNTNHNWGDRNDKREHCFMQAIRYLLFTKNAQQLMERDEDEEESDPEDTT